MWFAMLAAAWAGYGDAVDGFPTWQEREVHTWTNAARVDPAAFDDDYRAGGCRFDQFESDEKQPKAALAWVPGLQEAARVHSKDMADNRFVDHASSDGTGTFERIGRYYRGFVVGENVAGPYPNGRNVVMSGWMCSNGHRSNILEADFTELGASGIRGYFTQVFGSRGEAPPVMSMGVHTPENPTGTARLMVDVSSGARATDVVAIVNGEAWEMSLAFGDDKRGIWAVDIDSDDSCVQYWFEGTVGGDAVRWPEDGAYGYGDCAFDDDKAQWFDTGSLIGGGEGRDFRWTEERGCASTGHAGWLALLGLLALRRRQEP